MATETLIVELDSRTGNLERSLRRVEGGLDDVESATTDADGSLSRMSSTGLAVAGTMAKLTTGALAVATAMTAVIVNSAGATREMGLLAAQAKLSTDDFEALAFATKQYGVEAEGIADISKDIADKLGEFSKAGTGAFQDFADVVGLTKEEAKKTAIEFENMSSDEVIGEMIRQMEEAEASSNQMTFALESMGNDLSKLTPLFANNAEELKVLEARYKAVSEQLSLTSSEAKDLQEAATSFDLLTSAAKKSSEQISAQLAPSLNEFFNSVIEVVPIATQTIVDFINSFKDAGDIQSLESVNRLIEEQKTAVDELNDSLSAAVGVKTLHMTAEQNLAVQTAGLNAELYTQTERLKELEEQKEKIIAQDEKMADANKPGGGEITGGSGSSGSTGSTSDGSGTADEIAALEDRFKTEEELLLQKLERELVIAGENNQLRLDLENEYQEALAEIKTKEEDEYIESLERKVKADEELRKQEEKLAKETSKVQIDSQEAYVNAAVSLGNVLFEDNKAIKSGLVVVDTAAGIMKSFSELPYPAALAASISIGINGAAQLAAINSATKGSTSTPSSSSSSAPSVDTSMPEETSTLNVSDSNQSGQNQAIVIKFESDDTETARFVSDIINKATISGDI